MKWPWSRKSNTEDDPFWIRELLGQGEKRLNLPGTGKKKRRKTKRKEKRRKRRKRKRKTKRRKRRRKR